MPNKDRERKTLRMVYDEADFELIQEFEKPDFLLRRSSEEPIFGVEVTDFYYSESEARLENIDKYFAELLAGRPHRHKDDIASLKVIGGRATMDDGTEQDIKGILAAPRSVEVY